jgi:hypothetical protein
LKTSTPSASIAAFALAQWRYFRQRLVPRSAAVALAATGISAAFVNLAPFLLAVALTSIALVLGWSSGNRYASGSVSRRVLDASDATPPTLALGEAAVALALWSFVLLLASPALVISLSRWAIPPAAVASCLLLLTSAFMVSNASGFLASLLLGKTEHFVGGYVLAIWLLPGLFLSPALAVNPYAQAWKAFGLGQALPPLAASAVFLAAAAAAHAGSVIAMGAERRDRG